MKKTLITIVLILVVVEIGTVLFLSQANKEQQYIPTNVEMVKYAEEKYPELKNYWKYIPLSFHDGLKLVGVIQGNSDTNFRIVQSSSGEKEVSVIDGFRLMYKYPDTEHFAKMMVEKSKKEEYKNDKIKVIEELKFIAKGQNVDQMNYNGYEYYFIGNDHLYDTPVGMAVIFFPENQIITTIYFLNQEPENRKFQTIAEFISLKDNFIKGVIDNATDLKVSP